MTGGIPYYKTKYHKASEVPDEYVRQYSVRDPDNKVYQTRRFYDMKKKQIFFSQHDGIPVYMRTPMRRGFYYLTWTCNVGLALYGIYMLDQYSKGKLKK